MKHYSVEMITWNDHHFSQGSVDSEFINTLKPFVQVSVGYVVVENKKMIALAMSINEDHQMCEVLCLIKKDIVERIILKEKEDG